MDVARDGVERGGGVGHLGHRHAGGAGVLGAATMSAPFFGAELVGSLGVGTFYEAFDAKLVDQEADAELRALVEALVTAATAAPAS